MHFIFQAKCNFLANSFRIYGQKPPQADYTGFDRDFRRSATLLAIKDNFLFKIVLD
jgi:hypothetical protein